MLQSGMGAWAVKYPAIGRPFSHFTLAFRWLRWPVCFWSCGSSMSIREMEPSQGKTAWSSAYHWRFCFAAERCRGRLCSCVLRRIHQARCGGSRLPARRGRFATDKSGQGSLADANGVIFMHRIAALGQHVPDHPELRWLRVAGIPEPFARTFSTFRCWPHADRALSGEWWVGWLSRSDMQLASTLMHAALMTVLFLVLCEGCRLMLPYREPARAWSAQPQEAAVAHGAD